ncbi:hypothetical protein AXE65_12585 [Ventosimonas gracilis]|uniref:Uncharacterized protein n=1 Tax=Ventosimonas gracilis TaxID=1680762 RepID=A0A139SVZ5_9GAMM|nr:hypothetical protein AXE65_12585 [Ventosimonas gracilis]
MLWGDVRVALPDWFTARFPARYVCARLFDGLRSPRTALLGQLLSCCTSVKAVRLFLTWARETEVVDVDALLAQYSVRTGSDKRWMSHLADGTLLSLKPHGIATTPIQALDAALLATNPHD